MSQGLTLPSGIAHPSRLRPVSGLPVSIPLWEIAVLGISGVLAAASVGLIELQLRIPGHSILHAVLPMAFGLALAPRRFAGTGMSLAAIATAFGMMNAGHGEFGAGSWTSLACMGPSLDLMLGSRWGQRWPAFSVAVAGLLANGCAFVAKAIEKWSQIVPVVRGSGMGVGGGNGMGGGRGMGGGGGGGRGLGGGADLGRVDLGRSVELPDLRTSRRSIVRRGPVSFATTGRNWFIECEQVDPSRRLTELARNNFPI